MEGLTFSGQIFVFMLYYDLVEELIISFLLPLSFQFWEELKIIIKIQRLWYYSRYGLLAYKPSKNFCVDWKYRKGQKMFCLWLEQLDYTFYPG